ncbi:ion transporter [Mesorhizobium sp. Z1-4]|uniref:ion transporter n=1 Tax=Mesorhizobium sp. Z1-4 TaxID=2448478 RepID=UPI000FD8C288|nr:ion transporter [Mesorhizobium sp. Z1-4]
MNWRNHIGTALEGHHPGLGRRVELALLAIVAISALLMGIETLPDLPRWARYVLVVTDIVIIAIFTLEYALRILTAHNRRAYIFSFYGIVDLLSIAPFLLGLVLPWFGVDLRALRTLRLFRLFRLLKVARYTKAAERLAAAWRSVREEVAIFAVVATVLLYACALVVYQFEHEAQPEAFGSVFDALWWAAITLTTVGYGDVYPVTMLGRLFTVLILLVALGIVAVPTGLIASALTALRQEEREAAGQDK